MVKVEFDLEGIQGLITVVIVLSGVYNLGSCCWGWGCRCCCCRKRQPPPPVPEESAGAVQVETVLVNSQEIPVGHLRRYRDVKTCYLLWLGGGLFGAHHFYLDRFVHGLLAALSLNFFFVGWLLDMFTIPLLTRSFNKEVHRAGMNDGSCRRLCCFLPMMSVAIFGFLVGTYLAVPTLVKTSGLVDLDQKLAGTALNPFDILELPRGMSAVNDFDKVKKAYEDRLAELEKMQQCVQGTKECKKMRLQLTKAFRYVSTRQSDALDKMKADKLAKEKKEARKKGKRAPHAPPPESENDWQGHLQWEWFLLFEICSNNIQTLGEHIQSHFE